MHIIQEFKGRRLAQLATGLACVGALAAAGCGSSSDSSSGGSSTGSSGSSSSASSDLPATSVDLGNGTKVSFKAGEKLKIAMFPYGSGTSYVDTYNKSAKAEARKLGVSLDIFDPAGDPTKQIQQMQDAITSHKYNAAIVEPVAEGMCDLITRQMPAAGIMAVSTNAAICGNVSKPVEQAWAPGELAYVGGTQTIDSLQAWSDEIQKENPGPQRVLLVTGPKGNGTADNPVAAMEATQKAHPEFQVKMLRTATFQAGEGLKLVQDALQADKGVTVIATLQQGLTAAALSAVNQAGRTGRIKLYDIGGDHLVLGMIQKGDVQMSYPYYPDSMAKKAVDILQDARMGKRIARVTPNDGHPVESLRKPGDKLLFINKDNVAQVKAAHLTEY